MERPDRKTPAMKSIARRPMVIWSATERSVYFVTGRSPFSTLKNQQSPAFFSDPWLTLPLFSLEMDTLELVPKTDQAAHEHPRPTCWQAHQNFRGTRRTDWPRAGNSHFWVGWAQFRGVWTGSGAQFAHSAWTSGRAVHRAHQRGHHHAADYRLLFLPPDDRGLSERRRFVYRGALQPWRFSEPARGGGFAHGLYSYRSGRHFRGRWRASLRGPFLAATHRRDLRRHSHHHYGHQSSGSARGWRCIYGAHVPLRRHSVHHNCRRLGACAAQRWPSGGRSRRCLLRRT